MNITILFFITLVIALFEYQKSYLKLLSPTFWASGVTCVFSGVYVFTISTMRNDISTITLLIILSGICVTGIGCYLGLHVKFSGNKYSQYKTDRFLSIYTRDKEIFIESWKTIVLTLIYAMIAFIRVRGILSYFGVGLNRIIFAISQMRIVRDGVEIERTNGIWNQIGYFCDIAVYIYIFVFLYNLMVAKKLRLIYLLPLIPDFFIRLITTSRSAFIVLAFIFLVSYCFIIFKQGKCKIISISPVVIIGAVLGAILFVWYGRLRNDIDLATSDYIQMYTSAPIYNFDQYIRNGWPKNPYFGYYTLQKIYNVLRVTHSSSPQQNYLPMIVFNTHGMRSNIYTSFFKTVQDYGIFGMLLLRFLESFFATKIIKKTVDRKINNYKFYQAIYFVVIILYCFANFPIGNRFGDYLANGTVLLRYLIFDILLVKWFLKPKVISNR